MDTRRLFLVPLLAAALALFPAMVPAAAAQQESTLDVTVKIGRIDQLLNRIDTMAAETQPAGSQPPSMMLRAMLQGTDWIDPQRPVVIGIEMVGDQFSAAALVPFSRPNDNFAAAFNAMPAQDHYIVSLPPGNPLALSDAALASLVSASGVRPQSSISIEVAAQRLLQKASPMLNQRVAQMEIPTQPSPAGPKISGDEVRGIFEGLMQLGRQINTFSLGFDLDSGPFRFTTEAQAVAGTDLEALFSSGASTARLKKLTTGHHIQLKTHAYDIDRAVGLLSDLFGPLYQKLGIDIGRLAGITKHFTGESVGGFSYGADGVQLEMIAVLTGDAAKTDFIEEVYLPWMEDYSRQMTATLSNLYGTSIPQIHQRTKDTTVSGVRVAGAVQRQPFPTTEAGSTGPMTTITTEVRIAQIEDLILFAPNDNRMASLISAAKTMNRTATEPGPHIQIQVDLAAYFQGLMAMLPELEGEAFGLPQTARMETSLTLAGGRAVSQVTVMGAGLADLAAAAQAAKATGPAMADAGGRGASTRTEVREEPVAVAAPPLPPEKDPNHWFAKGALAATYGADKWAIKYFEKVVALDPQRSDAWFEMGISYGELRWFDKAVEAIDKAIALKPDSGLYYYGRGRIYLLLGAESQAMADFQQAADLGSKDAREYLQKAGSAS